MWEIQRKVVVKRGTLRLELFTNVCIFYYAELSNILNLCNILKYMVLHYGELITLKACLIKKLFNFDSEGRFQSYAWNVFSGTIFVIIWFLRYNFASYYFSCWISTIIFPGNILLASISLRKLYLFGATFKCLLHCI